MPASQPIKQDEVFHKLNPMQEIILQRLNERAMYMAHFKKCAGVVQTLTRLGYVKKQGGPTAGTTVVVTITPKGEEYLRKREASKVFSGSPSK
jgi:hypothetical protein